MYIPNWELYPHSEDNPLSQSKRDSLSDLSLSLFSLSLLSLSLSLYCSLCVPSVPPARIYIPLFLPTVAAALLATLSPSLSRSPLLDLTARTRPRRREQVKRNGRADLIADVRSKHSPTVTLDAPRERKGSIAVVRGGHELCQAVYGASSRARAGQVQ